MQDDVFFRQATVLICGNLEIHEGISAFLAFVNDFVPVNRVFMEHVDEKNGLLRFVVDARPGNGRRVSNTFPLPAETTAMIESRIKNGTIPDSYILNTPHEIELVDQLLRLFDQRAESIMVIPLDSPHGFIGNAVLVSETEQFSEEHLRLINLLREPLAVAMTNGLQHNDLMRLKDRLADDNRYLNDELRRMLGDRVVGQDHGLREVMEKVRRVAVYDSPVLLTGETGVGKDVIANAIHAMSTRSDGPFVGVNCGAIPEALVDSELFGHEKGAFTGALARRRGRFERANCGTIFLDEIGELPPAAQVRLLRVLQNREIERVGGTETLQLDLRVIAATNRDLSAMVASGEFREDLYFRLNVFPIDIPALRDRVIDIPDLVVHFVETKAKELKLAAVPAVAPAAMDALVHYDWPGNVRELQNVVERAMILDPYGPLLFEEIRPRHAATPIKDGKIKPLDQLVADHIRLALSICDGRVHGDGGAAELLGLNPSTLRGKMAKHGIDK